MSGFAAPTPSGPATIDDVAREAGLRTVLDLRASVLGWREGKAPAASRYIDLSVVDSVRATM